MPRSDDETAHIRALNDALRRFGCGGKILITRGIAALDAAIVGEILFAVATFDDFTPDNDPYGEHDCAVLGVAGHTIIWKVDYYDRTYTMGSPDPANPDLTSRVLTIMLAEEY